MDAFAEFARQMFISLWLLRFPGPIQFPSFPLF